MDMCEDENHDQAVIQQSVNISYAFPSACPSWIKFPFLPLV